MFRCARSRVSNNTTPAWLNPLLCVLWCIKSVHFWRVRFGLLFLVWFCRIVTQWNTMCRIPRCNTIFLLSYCKQMGKGNETWQGINKHKTAYFSLAFACLCMISALRDSIVLPRGGNKQAGPRFSIMTFLSGDYDRRHSTVALCSERLFYWEIGCACVFFFFF